MLLYTSGAEDTFALGRALGEYLRAGDTVALSGDLGAGKSVLARGIACALGVTQPMASPTFTLMQPYEGREKVYHFDLYRLADEDEFFAAGLSEFIGGDGVALVEWPIPSMDICPLIEVKLERAGGDEARSFQLRLTGMGERAEEMLRSLDAWEVRK